MNYSFNVDIATEYDIEQAVFLENLYFWIRKNETNKKHIHEGRCWTYNSQEAYSELFPFWNRLKIKRIIDKLENNNLILKGNFNKVNYDRTTWYALTDKGYELFGKKPLFKSEQSHCSELNNRMCESEQPIPDINTDINTDTSDEVKKIYLISEEESKHAYKVDDFTVKDNKVINQYKAVVGKCSPSMQMKIKEKLRNGIDSDVFIKAIEQAEENNATNWKYINAILNNWTNKRLYTLKDVEANLNSFTSKKVLSYSEVSKVPQNQDKKVYCGKCKNGWIMKLNGNDVVRVKCECNK